MRGASLAALSLLLGCAIPAAASQEAAFLPAVYDGLDTADITAATAAVQETLETYLSHVPRRWRNPHTGTSGEVMPLRTFRVADGRYCREYLETVMPAGGTAARQRSTACRGGEGLWRLVVR
jgi:surface antigen